MTKLTFPEDLRPEVQSLLATIKAQLPELEKLKASCDGHWGYEDAVYRFYHQSFKVFHLQDLTKRIATTLAGLAPERKVHPWFSQIVSEGTGKRFEMSMNQEWLVHARPIVEAFCHARFFLDMAIKYGTELDKPPSLLPSGWASVLYLYDLR